MALNEIGVRGMSWTDLARDGDRWNILTSMTMSLWVYEMLGSS
jgi:hypothetical protein